MAAVQLTPNQRDILRALRDHGPHLFLSGKGRGRVFRFATSKDGERVVVAPGNPEYFMQRKGWLQRESKGDIRDAIRFGLSEEGRKRAETIK